MYMNEDAAFERVKDLQREMENSRLWADHAVDALSLLTAPIVWLVELAFLGLRPVAAAGRKAPHMLESIDQGRDAA